MMPSRITGPAFPVELEEDLGLPQRRDPDHLPPRNAFELIMRIVHSCLLNLGSGNVLFAIKGGLLSVVLALPGLLRHSAQIAYGQPFSLYPICALTECDFNQRIDLSGQCTLFCNRFSSFIVLSSLVLWARWHFRAFKETRPLLSQRVSRVHSSVPL